MGPLGALLGTSPAAIAASPPPPCPVPAGGGGGGIESMDEESAAGPRGRGEEGGRLGGGAVWGGGGRGGWGGAGDGSATKGTEVAERATSASRVNNAERTRAAGGRRKRGAVAAIAVVNSTDDSPGDEGVAVTAGVAGDDAKKGEDCSGPPSDWKGQWCRQGQASDSAASPEPAAEATQEGRGNGRGRGWYANGWRQNSASRGVDGYPVQ